MSTKDQIDCHRRFLLLRRDGFKCAYCGCQPGNERLQVDHMVSVSANGSDHDNNLITTCDRCNNGKGAEVSVPESLCNGARDFDGWITWKLWGIWSLKWNPSPVYGDEVVVISAGFGVGEYWIGSDKFHEGDWEEHIREKSWVTNEDYLDFCDAIAFARSLFVGEVVAV